MFRSLRFRLVLLSTLISGAVIVAMALVTWHFMSGAFRAASDLRLEETASRIIGDMHPRADWEELVEHVMITHEDSLTEQLLVLEIRDEVQDRQILSTKGAPFAIADVAPAGFPKKLDHPESRPEWNDGRPPRGPGKGGKGKGPKEAPPENWWDWLEENPKGEKGKSGSGKGFDKGRIGGESEVVTVRHDGNEWRLLAVQERGYSVIAGTNLAESNRSVAHLRNGFLIGVPLAVGLIAFGGWLVADRAMRPLREITETANRITASELGARMPEPSHPDPEIGHLIAVLNRMMNRLEASFSHVNRFSADVSHELKTPVAVIQGEIESALRNCESGSPEEERLFILQREASQLKGIIRSLLLLAQADAGALIRKADLFNLSAELESFVDDGEVLGEEQEITLHASIEDGLMLCGDAVLLRQAFLNLVNNAIKYNRESGYVRVLASRSRNEITVEVENSGPGIETEDRERVFERFYRGDKSRGAEGFGLGLSLSQAVFEGHGGSIRLGPEEDDSTLFIVSLPVAGTGPQTTRIE